MKIFFRFLLSLPIYAAGLIVLHAVLVLNYAAQTQITYSLLAGLVLGSLLFTFVCRLKRFYIFGHELAHWIFAKVFMKETRNFKVGKNSGAVQVKNPNIWVVLAPYFYPTFTILWLPFWFAFRYFKDEIPYSLEIFFVVLGLSWAYHLVLTLYALKFEQSDIERAGRPLSFSIIFFINMVFIYGLLSLITNGPQESLIILWDTVKNDCSVAFNIVSLGLDELRMFISSLN